MGNDHGGKGVTYYRPRKWKHKFLHRGESKMCTKLDRIAEIARNNPKDKFTSLMHLVNKEMLTMYVG